MQPIQNEGSAHMRNRVSTRKLTLFTAALVMLPVGLYAQGGRGGGRGAGGGAPAAPANAKGAAPIDLTGYWVSVITEDWRYRMVLPTKGDFQGVPMTAAARTAANAWDPAKEAGGDQCKAYGAPALLREPTRLHITWEDDNTLKMESDAGKQVRLLHFGDWKAPGGAPSRQGDSVADWEGGGRGGRGGRGGGGGGGGVGGGGRGENPTVRLNEPADASLKVVTTNLMGGYLRKNGVPYSDKTKLTEYFDLMREPNGDTMVVVTIITEDPTYLTRDFVISSQFKKEPGDTNAKWKPSECSATF
jgi:hypothetical protein